jgi:hypothetical protein
LTYSSLIEAVPFSAEHIDKFTQGFVALSLISRYPKHPLELVSGHVGRHVRVKYTNPSMQEFGNLFARSRHVNEKNSWCRRK